VLAQKDESQASIVSEGHIQATVQVDLNQTQYSGEKDNCAGAEGITSPSRRYYSGKMGELGKLLGCTMELDATAKKRKILLCSGGVNYILKAEASSEEGCSGGKRLYYESRELSSHTYL